MFEQNFIKSNSMRKILCWNYVETVENAKEHQKRTSTCKASVWHDGLLDMIDYTLSLNDWSMAN